MQRDQTRGQTTLDFAIGISLFLLVLTGIFLFVPGALQPFAQGAQEDTVTVNRVADTLGESLLSNTSTPYILNRTCTVAYFEDGNGDADDDYTTAPDGCDYSGDGLKDTLGLSESRSVNVTIEGNISSSTSSDSQLCWNVGTQQLDALSNCVDSGDTALRLGGTPPGGSQSSVTARRVVAFEDRDVFLIVKIW